MRKYAHIEPKCFTKVLPENERYFDIRPPQEGDQRKRWSCRGESDRLPEGMVYCHRREGEEERVEKREGHQQNRFGPHERENRNRHEEHYEHYQRGHQEP